MLNEQQYLAEMAELADSLETESGDLRKASGLPDGLHLDVPAEVYHRKELGVASTGALRKVRISAAKYRAWLDEEEKPRTPALSFGTACHMRLLEPERFARTYVVAPDFGDCRLKANKANRDAWRRERITDGSTILEHADDAAIFRIVESIAADDLAAELLSGGFAEATLRWGDADTGIICKARPDYYRRDVATCIDFKTAMDASEAGFNRSLSSFDYHLQAAHYVRGLEAIDEPIEHFLFIVAEKEPPYDFGVFELDEEDLEQGRREVRAALRTMADCLTAGRFPGYPKHIQTARLLPWRRDRR